MVRLAALCLAGSLSLLGSAALAQAGTGYYNVTLASAPDAGKQIVRGMAFNCTGATCVAGEGTSRPAIICASVAKELGPITAFSAGGEALDGEALAKCNAKADTTRLAKR